MANGLLSAVAPPPKQLALPNDEQWRAILAEAGRNVGYGGRGAGWLIRFLAYTGARLQEARGYSEHEMRRLANFGGADPLQTTGVRKRDVDLSRNMISCRYWQRRQRTMASLAGRSTRVDRGNLRCEAQDEGR